MPSLANLDQAIVTEDVLFRAGSYQLHGELAYPEAGCARGAVVIAGPHPLLGGNLRNNVVRGIGDGLARHGLLTLRFDYRGAGRSQGPRLDVARHLAEFSAHFPRFRRDGLLARRPGGRRIRPAGRTRLAPGTRRLQLRVCPAPSRQAAAEPRRPGARCPDGRQARFRLLLCRKHTAVCRRLRGRLRHRRTMSARLVRRADHAPASAAAASATTTSSAGMRIGLPTQLPISWPLPG